MLFLLTGCSGNTSKDDYVDSYQSLSQEDADTICLLFNAVGCESYDYYDAQYIEDIFIVSVSNVGLAEVIQDLKMAGYNESSDLWVPFREAFVELYNGHRQFLDDSGLEEIDILLNVVNDLNPDNILLSIAFGEVIYDYMAE